MVSESPAFKQAIIDSKKLTSKPSDDDLLQLYALFKIGKGEDLSKAEKPGMFDLKGKAKYNAWSKVAGEGTSATDAQTKYAALVEKLKKSHGFDASKA